jgi:hypothetical protein
MTMEADELFDHALTSLPEAVGDLLRDGKDPREFVFASFDGASQLGMAFIASDLAVGDGSDDATSRAAAQRLLAEAEEQGEELIVSFMLPRDSLTRLLDASHVDAATRLAVGLWLDAPLHAGHFRVVALAGDHVRAATVDATSGYDGDDAPVSSSLLN